MDLLHLNNMKVILTFWTLNYVDWLCSFSLLILSILFTIEPTNLKQFFSRIWEKHDETYFSISIFLSGFSFTDTDNPQDSRDREGTIFCSTLPSSPAHEHSDIYLQLCTWDDYHIFLIAILAFIRLLFDEIYHLIKLLFDRLMMWYWFSFVCLLIWF